MKRNCTNCKYSRKERSNIVRYYCNYQPSQKEIMSLFPRNLELLKNYYGSYDSGVKIDGLYSRPVTKQCLFDCERWELADVNHLRGEE